MQLGHWGAVLPSPDPEAGWQGPKAWGPWALQYTPRVAWVEGVALLMEVQASARLWGGMVALESRVGSEVAAQGGRIAWAPTGLGALALVRAGRPSSQGTSLASMLDGLPLRALGAAAGHAPVLESLGCGTLGAVRQLPRAGVVRRFGHALLAALDQAYGLQPEVYEWIRPPEVFAVWQELPFRTDSAATVLGLVVPLLHQLAQWLSLRHLGVLAFAVHWEYDALRSRHVERAGSVTVRTARAMRQVDHLLALLREHLAQSPWQAPIIRLGVEALEVATTKGEAPTLVPDPGQQGLSVDRALERIEARLGPGAVVQAELRDDWRWEWMQEWRSALRPQGKPRPGVDLPSVPAPTWLLEAPVALTVLGDRPCYQGPLQLLLGPHRIEGGWWHRDATGASQLVQRDYWLAHSPGAGLLWVFQQRLRTATDEAWFLHGFFA